jgi:DinB superfamily
VPNWGPSTYGQPCRACAFDWSLTLDDATALMSQLGVDYGDLLAGATGAEHHSDLAWPVAAYVSHVADNLRIWTERLMGVALGASPMVGGYDENELAQARKYAMIPLEAALWSLRRAVAEWLEAVDLSSCHGTLMIHPDRGELDLLDVVTSNVHDAHHHLWDVRRSLAGPRRET